jgi:hypothetical protein
MTGITDASWFPNLITGACTLSAGLGGVALTLGITGKRQKSERAIEHLKERNREQRQAIIEVLDSGRAWEDSQEIIFFALAATSKSVDDSIDFANTDSAASHGVKLTRYRKALIGARLLVTDQEIAPLIQHLSKHLAMLPEHTGHVIEAAKQSKDSELEALAKATAYTKVHLDSLNELERITLERLTDPGTQ